MTIIAPEFPRTVKWVNIDQPLSLRALRGHVVLLDFWTYCCINCIHVIPDLHWIEQRFKNDPFIVIGVHSPKFKNEKNEENIRNAIRRYGISHPVVSDEIHQIWDSYAVRAWPTFALIDSEGKLRGMVSGEKKRETLQQAIENLLAEGRAQGLLAREPLRPRYNLEPQVGTLSFPGKLAALGSDDLVISDSGHNRLVRVNMVGDRTGKVTAVIGNGEAGSADGSTSTASFNHPQGLCFRGDSLYVADTDNHLIRKVDLVENRVETIAVAGVESSGVGGKARSIQLNSPWDLEEMDGTLYVAMAGAHQLWALDLSSGEIRPFVGSGHENIIDGPFDSADLAQPSGISSDGKDLYFVDSEASAVRKAAIGERVVKTLVGRGLFVFGHRDGEFEHALFQHPIGINCGQGTLFVADTYNHAIRRLDLGGRRVETLIGRDSEDLCEIGGKSCDFLPLNEPNDVIFWRGKLWVADTNNHLIRIFDPTTGRLTDLRLE